MADGGVISSLLTGSGAASGLSKEDSSNLENLSTNSKGFLDGINENKSIVEKQLDYVSDIAVDVGSKGWFADTLNQLVKNFEEQSTKNDEGKILSENIRDTLEDMKIFEETTATDNKEKKKKRGKVTDRAKIDDLKSLPYEFATLGAVLAATLSKKDEKKEKGGGISGFFKGLLEGVGGIAALGVALLAFAGAVLIFNFVDWGKAVIGLLAFTVFTIGMVAIAKLLSKEQNNLIEFATASLLLSAALGVFAVSLYVVSAVVSAKAVTIAGKEIVPAFNLMNAIKGTAVFLGFLVGIAIVSNIASKENETFVDFAKASLILSIALSVFAVSLYVTSAIVGSQGVIIAGKQILPAFNLTNALIGTGIFLVFLAVVAVISRIAGGEQQNFSKFATVSMLMSLSLVLFSFSLVIVSALYSSEEVKIGEWTVPKVDLQGALIGLGFFLGFLLAFTGVAILANTFGGNIAMFTAISLLMSVSLITFSVAMAITASVVSGDAVQFGNIKFDPPDDVAKNAGLGILAMAAFMTAFAGLGALFLVPFAGQALLAGLAAASVALLSISVTTILFSKAMMLAGLAVSGGSAEIEGKKYNIPKYNEKNTDTMFQLMENFIVRFADVATSLNKKGMKAVELLGKSVIPIIDAMDKMVNVVIKAGQNYDSIIKIVNGDSTVLDHLMDPVMYVILGHNLDGNGGLMYVAQNMSKYSGKVLNIVVQSLVPITEAMGNMIDVVIKAADSRESIENMMNSKGGMDALNHLLDPVVWMILGPNADGKGGLMYVANHMSKKSGQVLKLVAESMLPLTEAMSNMIDIVYKAADLNVDGKSTEELVALAMDNLNLILKGKGSITGFIPMYVATASSLKKTSKDAIEAINAMPPMVQALGDLVGVIEKAGDLDPAKIDTGIYGLTAASNFLVTFIKTINDIIPGGVGGALTKFFGGDPIKKVKEAHDYLKQGGAFYNVFQDLANIAKSFDGKGFENLGKVAIVGSFTTDMLKGSDNFKDIMKNIQKGLDNLSKPQSMTTIGNALDQIANARDISGKFDPIYELVDKTSGLSKVADQFERIAKSYKSMSEAEKVGSMTDKLGLFGIQSSTSSANPATAAVKNNNSGKKSVEDILNEWNEKGVKIRQNFTNDVKEEDATPVNLLSIDS